MAQRHSDSSLESLRGVLPDKAVDVLQEALRRTKTDLEPTGRLILTPPTANSDATTRVKMSLEERAIAKLSGECWGPSKWCKTTAAWSLVANPNSGLDEYWVTARGCSRGDGLDAAGQAFDVRLVVTGDYEPELNVGDVIPFFIDLNGVNVGQCSVRAKVVSGVSQDWKPATRRTVVAAPAPSAARPPLRVMRESCQACAFGQTGVCLATSRPIEQMWESGQCPQNLWTL